ncbi:hypothetical protein ACFQ38_02560 [Sporosarcina contaminans]|uniref:Prophage pi2 protein 40 n=1 Tax=Sporosarcina contaminans TaxID=633403 RepID=A0ABW3TTC8_9BACL
MEKTLTIDGRQVTFKSTAGTPKRYKAQFGNDYFADMLRLYSLSALQNLDPENMDYEAIKNLDLEVFYNMLWAMAKTYDSTIPDPQTWLDEFDEFPIFEIIPEVQEMITKNLQTSKKK